MTTLTLTAGAPPRSRVEWTGLAALLAFVAALQFSIAAAGVLLSVAAVCWAASLAIGRERLQTPAFYTPLLVYAGVTLVASVFSLDPATSFQDSKQLVLFLIPPIVMRLASGERTLTVLDVIVSAGAASATIGIVQYGVFEFDNLGKRPHGALGHYMTYSGLLLLVISAAIGRVLFARRGRMWPALVLPALGVALVLTFSRSAWVGACASVSTLLMLRDFRLVALMPVVLAVAVAASPASVTERMYSMFNPNDPTVRDRLAMARTGVAIIRDDPWTGVGPNMIERVYAEYRDPLAVEKVNPHLHNVPIQIAAERGLPALAAWLWFVVSVFRDLAGRLRSDRARSLAATGLAAMVGMLAAGLFEHNFGDSEFLMLLLVLITLPTAADRQDADA
jgi:O-antigen ligase